MDSPQARLRRRPLAHIARLARRLVPGHANMAVVATFRHVILGGLGRLAHCLNNGQGSLA